MGVLWIGPDDAPARAALAAASGQRVTCVPTIEAARAPDAGTPSDVPVLVLAMPAGTDWARSISVLHHAAPTAACIAWSPVLHDPGLDSALAAGFDAVHAADETDWTRTLRRARHHATARRRASAEASYRTFFQRVPSGAAVLDAHGQVVAVNPAFARTLGYTADDLLGRTLLDLLHPEQAAADGPALTDVVTGHTDSHSVETRLVRRDGADRWMRVHLFASHHGSRPAERTLFAFLEDVTERQGSDGEHERGALFRALFEHTAVGLSYVTPAEPWVRVNPATQRMLGQPPQFSGERLMELTHPEDRFKDAELFHELIAGQRDRYEFEKRYLHGETGETVWCHLTVSLERDAAGTPRRVFGTVLDITARKQAEEALRQSETRFRTFFENAAVGMAVADPATGILEINSALRQILGWVAPTLSADEVDQLSHPDDRARDRELLNELLRGQRDHYRLEKRYVRPDGRTIWGHVTMSTSRDPATGRPGAVFATLEDITDQKESQAVLEAAREAALASSRAKSDFLANMSHEIRTPMNGVLGMLNLALDTALSPEQRDYLQVARTSAESLLSVINDVLDFSKIEAGKLALSPVPFRLGDDLGDTVSVLALRGHEKDLEIAFSVAPEVPDALVGDLGRLRQVVVNLVGNAIKFTPRGEVGVRVEAASRAEGEVVLHFAVSDTGIGIPPEKQRLIFEAFAQADTSTTREYGGTGLGLAISSQLVEAMGGQIWVESEVGRGSTFHFTARFGLDASSTPKPYPWTSPTADLQGVPVLVVDDNATNRRILEQMLASWGMQPTVTDGGPAALAVMQDASRTGRRYPLILVDLRMPGMDGFALVERLKQHPAFAGAAIMMLSSSDLRSEAARCQALGVAACLTKPIRATDLCKAIGTALGKLDADESVPSRAPDSSVTSAPRRLKILLAEDNPVNQKLAVALLEKRGHAVVLANNGRQALEALDKEPFDLVLMDVQMPEMGGFGATAEIRAKERETGAHVPIIAMTARTMQGDRERCLDVGMDGYVAKPIRAQELFGIIESLVYAGAPAESEVTAAGSGATILSEVDLLHTVNGDLQLLAEIVALFRSQCPDLVSAIRAAITCGDAGALQFAAHSLKSSLGSLAAHEAAEVARRLEQLGREGDLAQAEAAYSALEAALRRLEPALAALVR